MKYSILQIYVEAQLSWWLILVKTLHDTYFTTYIGPNLNLI